MQNQGNHHPQSRPARVKAFQDHQAILVLDDSQEIRWPIASLPSGTAIGETVFIMTHSGKTEDEERLQLAHAILNDMFNTPSGTNNP